jgi:hypothetical protein
MIGGLKKLFPLVESLSPVFQPLEWTIFIHLVKFFYTFVQLVLLIDKKPIEI